jgi:hypothetical protein
MKPHSEADRTPRRAWTVMRPGPFVRPDVATPRTPVDTSPEVVESSASEEISDALEKARELLADGGVFERSFDFPAAVARARAAAALLGPLGSDSAVADLAAEVALATRRFERHESEWRREVEVRRDAYVARESADAGQGDE